MKKLEEAVTRVAGNIIKMSREEFEERMHSKTKHWSHDFIQKMDMDDIFNKTNTEVPLRPVLSPD